MIEKIECTCDCEGSWKGVMCQYKNGCRYERDCEYARENFDQTALRFNRSFEGGGVMSCESCGEMAPLYYHVKQYCHCLKKDNCKHGICDNCKAIMEKKDEN